MVRGVRAKLGLVLLALVACAKEAPEEAALPADATAALPNASGQAAAEVDEGALPEQPTPRATRGGEVGGPGERWGPNGSATPESALTLPNVQSCQASCVDRGATRGVGAQQLDLECRTQCKKECLAQCELATSVAKKACTADCERQVARLR